MTIRDRDDPDPAPRPVEAARIRGALSGLGWEGPVVPLAQLGAGGSGSLVVLVDLGVERAVLKLTDHPAWQERARHELAVHQELGAAMLQDDLPALRAGWLGAHAVALLLAAHPPQPPAAGLTDAAWVELAQHLGRLQSAATPLPRWLRRSPWPSAREVVEALDRWDARGLAPVAARAAGLLPAAERVVGGLDRVLTHGDCHLGNLLRGPGGRPLWVDWQEVGLGTGLEDLVFLWQRAEFDGAQPPRAAMTEAYAGARSLAVDGALRAGIAAVELRLLLVSWSSYLTVGGPQGQRVLARRLERLVDEEALN